MFQMVPSVRARFDVLPLSVIAAPVSVARDAVMLAAMASPVTYSHRPSLLPAVTLVLVKLMFLLFPPWTRITGPAPLIRELSEGSVKVNVTALFTTAQVELIVGAVRDGAASYLSVFAGRIADAGIDPVPIMARAVKIATDAPRAELIWASPREILNVVQADQIGCHIITITHDLLPKLDSLGKDLDQFSLETVRMFHRDAVAAGFEL